MAHPQDIVLVKNIHTDCDWFDEEEGYSHKDYFQVRFDNMPFRIGAGEVRRMPMYLADHFKKHLADHILMQIEDEGKGKMMLRNTKARENLYKEMTAGVEETFKSEGRSQIEIEAQRVEELNKDFLEKTKAAYRSTRPVEDSEESDEPMTDDVPPPPEDYSKWSRPDLFRELKERGVKATIKETNEQLISKLQEA